MNSMTDFQKKVSTDESTFELVSQRRQFVRRPRGPVETRFMPQYLVNGCKGQIFKNGVRGDIVARHACASYGHWDTQY